MMIRLTAVSACALLSLAACGRDDRPAAQAPTDAAPVAMTPAEQPPSAPAADPNTLTSEGLGAARIGMSKADLIAAWGERANPKSVGGAEPEVCDQFHPVRAPEGVNVMIQDGKLTRITLMRGARIKTDRGFGLGDTAMAIKQAYGGSIFVEPHKYQAAPAEDLFVWARGGSTNYVADPSARGVRYEIGMDGKVSMIHAGDPSIQLVEGCS
ncbi:hypothetical protein SH203_00075 [Brevundimonas sp. SH203]|uniref:hypothetical protein n=1 Tax=Brevundimonas sp. SH203 TaxID=345167 RepID=UPI0009D11839|nr:hypothetical protein [Brevundimonas sp. SH203]GAW39699.1 hypothetical protein SH203_00075 [Brevundimonas sp. SH203]